MISPYPQLVHRFDESKSEHIHTFDDDRLNLTLKTGDILQCACGQHAIMCRSWYTGGLYSYPISSRKARRYSKRDTPPRVCYPRLSY